MSTTDDWLYSDDLDVGVPDVSELYAAESCEMSCSQLTAQPIIPL